MKKSLLLVLLIPFVLLACSAPPVVSECECSAPPPVPHEHAPDPYAITVGARLVPLLLEASDGLSAPIENAWFDTAPSIYAECSFAPTPTGVLMCLPRMAPVQDWYLDAACTQRVAIAAACNPLPKFGQSKIGDACGSLDVGTVYALRLDEAVSDVPLYLKLSASSCSPQPDALGANNVAIPVDQALAPDAFVTATRHAASAP